MDGLKKYKRKVNEMLPCTTDERKYVMAEIDRSLDKGDYALSYESLIDKLGAPEEIAAASIAGMDPRNIALTMEKRHKLITWVAILVIGVLLIWAVGVTAAVIDSTVHSGGHAIIGSAEIIETVLNP